MDRTLIELNWTDLGYFPDEARHLFPDGAGHLLPIDAGNLIPRGLVYFDEA